MSGARRRRVWQRAEVLADGDGYRIMLDQRPLRLPGGAVLTLRRRELAEAVAVEWQAAGGEVGGTFGPEAIELTALAATLQERVAPAREAMVASLLAEIDRDLLCYRAAHPPSLVARQERGWQPWLEWCQQMVSAKLVVGTGVMPVTQPEPALLAMRRALARRDDPALVALGVLAPLLGSLVLGLAAADGALAPEAAADLALLDTLHQAERWGLDDEVARRRDRMAREAAGARRFVVLARGMVAERWLIDGRVQGVGYRVWLQAEAGARDILGWVRNLVDGRVEAVLQGPAEHLAELRRLAGRGPPGAAPGQVRGECWAGPVPAGPFARRADAATPEAANHSSPDRNNRALPTS